MREQDRPLCGIDEAGRGCIAGSLVMAGVVLVEKIEGLMDSKRLTEKRREELYTEIVRNTQYHIVSFSAKEVDHLGISKCLKLGLETIQREIPNTSYLFDGNRSFGVGNIETMVKADMHIPEVSAASILAKVTHDREIVDFAKRYPEYGFERHKGYVTKQHIEAVKQYGRSPVHRKTFRIKEIDEPTLF